MANRAATRPTFLLVPGILHTKVHLEPLAEALRQNGFESVSVDLASVATADGPAGSAANDALVIKAQIEDLVLNRGKEVVCVFHSYGGCPGSQAIMGLDRTSLASKGRTGGVIQLVFLAPFLVPNGETVLSTVISSGQTPAPWFAPEPSGLTFAPNDLASEYLYHDLDAATAGKYSTELRPINVDHLQIPAKNTCWSMNIACLYIHTLQDRAVWPATQLYMLESVKGRGCAWTIVEMDCGHSPFLSHTDQLLRCIFGNI